MNLKACGSTTLPLADRAHKWDGSAAAKRVLEWAGFYGDSPDPEKAKRGFFIYDADAPDNKTSYKLPFADMVDGSPKAVPGGLFAVAGALRGARTPLQAPPAVKDAVKRRVAVYYRKLERPVPWKASEPVAPPQDVADTAGRAMVLARYNEVPAAVRVRAQSLARCYPQGRQALEEMQEFFNTHKPDDWLAWQLHGGAAGREWVERVLEEWDV